MIGFDFDWPFVRRYTILPAATALAAMIALFSAVLLQTQQAERHEQFSNSQSVVQEDYDALVYRRRIVDRYHRRYQQFSELGFVGLESRLDWIETLRSSSKVLTLPRVSYVIQPQLTVAAPVESILVGDNIQIHMSRLELEMNLVHEMDLLRFVDEIQQNAPGLMRVNRCALNWQPETDAPLRAAANILASCDIEIYSVITSDVSARASS